MKKAAVFGIILGLLIACSPGYAAPDLKENPRAFIFQEDYFTPMVLLDENGVKRSEEEFDILTYVNFEEQDDSKKLFGGGKSNHIDSSGERFLLALFSSDGKQLTEYAYRGFSMETGSDWIAFTDADGFVGIMDRETNVIIEPKYAMLCPLRNGGALALKQSPYNLPMDEIIYDDPEDVIPQELIYITPDGVENPTGIMATTEPFYIGEGRLNAQCSMGMSNVCMLIDETGSRVTEQDYRWMYQIRSDMDRIVAFVGSNHNDSATGVMDLDGRWIIEPKYDVSIPMSDWIDPANPRYFCVEYQEERDSGDVQAYIFADDGSVVFTGEPGARAYWIGDTLRWFRGDEKWITDKDGNLLLDIQANTNAEKVSEDRYIEQTGYWPEATYHLTDGEGKLIAGPFASLDNPFYANVDDSQRVLTYLAVSRPRDPANGELNNTYHTIGNYLGLITIDGQIIGKPIYDMITTWGVDRLCFRSGPNAGIMDTRGNWLYVQSEYANLID